MNAAELVAGLKKCPFEISIAAYPIHPDFRERQTDLGNLKRKVDAGLIGRPPFSSPPNASCAFGTKSPTQELTSKSCRV
jgi:hypothetical protein